VRGYLLGRLLWVMPTILGMTLVTFVIMRMLPGDVAVVMVGIEGRQDPQVLENIRRSLGLDQPLPVQYVHWLVRTLQGDWGTSVAQKVAVRDEILRRLPVTLELAFLSALVALISGVPLGLVAALRRGIVDWLVRGFNVVAIAVPNFFLGTLMLLFGARFLPFITAFEYIPPTVDPIRNLISMSYPALALGAGLAAVIAENTRAAILEVRGADYITLARAKGLGPGAVVTGYLLRNALIPVVTVSGLQVTALLGGTIVIETIFGLPGIGRLMFTAVNLRDYPMVQGIVLVVATMVVVTNLLVDLLYAFVDPRVRYGR
jgi:peptide/nickel transport system permease protein